MTDSFEAEQARRYRMKAEEYRMVADQAKTSFARDAFRRMALTYDRMADNLDQRDSQEKVKRPYTG